MNPVSFQATLRLRTSTTVIEEAESLRINWSAAAPASITRTPPLASIVEGSRRAMPSGCTSSSIAT